MLRWFLDSVHNLTTGMETGRLVARARHVLSDFCGAVGVAVPAGARPQRL